MIWFGVTAAWAMVKGRSMQKAETHWSRLQYLQPAGWGCLRNQLKIYIFSFTKKKKVLPLCSELTNTGLHLS